VPAAYQPLCPALRPELIIPALPGITFYFVSIRRLSGFHVNAGIVRQCSLPLDHVHCKRQPNAKMQGVFSRFKKNSLRVTSCVMQKTGAWLFQSPVSELLLFTGIKTC